MIYQEELMDLGEIPKEYYIAHCTSADYKSTQFAREQLDWDNHHKQILESFGIEDLSPPSCLITDNLFNLFVKPTEKDRADIRDILLAMVCMKTAMNDNNITKVAIPIMGTEHGTIDWNEIRNVIEIVFYDTDADILVCI